MELLLVPPNQRRASLELLLGLLLVCVHRLEEPKPAALDGLNILLLLLACLLVLLLQAIDERLKVRLQLLHLRLLRLDHLLTLLRSQPLVLGDGLLLVLIAEIEVGGAARRAQSLRMLLQIIKGPAALVVLQVIRVPILDCRVAPDTHLVTEGLATC